MLVTRSGAAALLMLWDGSSWLTDAAASCLLCPNTFLTIHSSTHPKFISSTIQASFLQASRSWWIGQSLNMMFSSCRDFTGRTSTKGDKISEYKQRIHSGMQDLHSGKFQPEASICGREELFTCWRWESENSSDFSARLIFTFHFILLLAFFTCFRI